MRFLPQVVVARIQSVERPPGWLLLKLFLAAAAALLLLGTASAGASNSIVTVDSDGDVGLHTSLALDADGNPVVSYFDNTNNDLKLLRCGDPNCSTGNTIVTVDSDGDVGRYSSLALDSQGNPVISYYEGLFARNLKLVKCGSPDCSSGNTIVTVDSDGDVGEYTSLALVADHPVISYYDSDNGNLKLARCGNPDCTSSSIVTVDSDGDVGSDTSLALDSNGNPVISYRDTSNRDLKLARCGNADCTSGNTIAAVDTSLNVGTDTSLVLDAAGYPAISYRDVSGANLKVARCSDAACTGPVSITTPDSDGSVGRFTSLALKADRNPVVSYYDLTNESLRVLGCGNAHCSAGNSIVTVDSEGNVGQYTSLQLSEAGNPVVSYRDVSNGALKILHCIDPNCTGVVPTPTPTPPPALQGDVDCDGTVNSVDALMILRDIAGLAHAAECMEQAGDVNCDGALTAVDALGILRFVAALPPLAAPDGCVPVGDPL